MRRIAIYFENTPLWFINFVTVVSGILTVISGLVGFISFFYDNNALYYQYFIPIVILFSFILILFFRTRKYRTISNNRMEKISCNYHKFLHESRNTYFEVMQSHKNGTLTTSELSSIYKMQLSRILDNLCEIMQSFTKRNVSACIKLITYNSDEETIDINNTKLITFCRSTNSNTQRSSYETQRKILLKDNSDFFEIVNPDNDKNYFYAGNLEEYDRQLKKINRSGYKNTNPNWRDYYKSTIVVPIKIAFNRLYNQKKDCEYHILGFLCVDSPYIDAFTDKQEQYNVDILKSFADMLYILIGQYRHYLKKLDSTKVILDK